MPPEAERLLRPFWSGTLSFGLVSIPVDLFPGQRRSRPVVHLLAPDGTPLERRYFCPADGQELAPDEIVRGFELAYDELVLVTDEELDAVEPEKSRDIDLRVFVPRDEIPPLYAERSYVLTPAGSSSLAYRLLAETMQDAGRAGIATFVMRGKEYLVAILSDSGVLRAETLRFHDEVRSAEAIGLPVPEKPARERVGRFAAAVKDLAATELDEAELTDRDAEALRDVAEAQGVRVDAPPESEDTGTTKILDLVAFLRRELEGDGTETG